MKMKLVDRILLGLYAVLGILGSAAVALGGVYIFNSGGITSGFLGLQIPGGTLTLVIACVIALLLLAWSIKMLLLAFKHEPRVDKTSVSVQNTEDGSVRITVAALDTLIKQAIGHHDGIMEIKSRIINHEDSISVHIDMTLSSDVHIPNVTMLLQRTVKNFIEEFSGIAVREVSVLVSSIIEIVPAPLAIEAKRPVEAAVVQVVEDEPEEIREEVTPVEEAAPIVEEIAVEDEPAPEEAPVEAEIKETEPAEETPEETAQTEETDPEKDIW